MPTDSVVGDRLDDYRESLFDLLRQPTVSATGEGITDGAGQVTAFFEDHGFDARQIPTERNPLIYAERLASTDAPTVVFYGHYDVQPADHPGEWKSPAFEPTVREESIYARGAGDNKGQFACHAFAVDALARAGELPEVNVKCLIEGGEESGSLGLRAYLDGEGTESTDLIADADLVYVADGPQHRSGRPTLIYGNRGILTFQLDHHTADSDLHSGNFGGPVPNAATELAELVGSMVDGDRVTIDGFHDEIEISEADRNLVEEIPFDAEAMQSVLGISRFATEKPYYERLLLEPTLTVNGLDAGYQGDGSKTIVPNEATAKCDCRLVPGQDPDEVFETIEAHVERENPDVTVERGASFPPMKTPVESPRADPVRGALAAVWDDDPVELPVLGGSLPAAFFRSVDELADVPVLVVPYANPDQGNHSPNEHLDLDCFENGIETSAEVLRRVAEV